MRETIVTVRDKRIISAGIALSNALELERNIKSHIQEGKRTIYLIIHDKTGSHSSNLAIGDDLLQIAQGAAFGAYRQLAYIMIFVKKTGEEVKVINLDGKAIADGIISDMSR